MSANVVDLTISDDERRARWPVRPERTGPRVKYVKPPRSRNKKFQAAAGSTSAASTGRAQPSNTGSSNRGTQRREVVVIDDDEPDTPQVTQSVKLAQQDLLPTTSSGRTPKSDASRVNVPGAATTSKPEPSKSRKSAGKDQTNQEPTGAKASKIAAGHPWTSPANTSAHGQQGHSGTHSRGESDKHQSSNVSKPDSDHDMSLDERRSRRSGKRPSSPDIRERTQTTGSHAPEPSTLNAEVGSSRHQRSNDGRQVEKTQPSGVKGGAEKPEADMAPRKSIGSTASIAKSAEQISSKETKPALLRKTANSGPVKESKSTRRSLRPELTAEETPSTRHSTKSTSGNESKTGKSPIPSSNPSVPKIDFQKAVDAGKAAHTKSLSAKEQESRKSPRYSDEPSKPSNNADKSTGNALKEASGEAQGNTVDLSVVPEKPALVEMPEISNEILTLPGVETVLRNYVKEMRDDHEYLMKHLLPRARRCYERGRHSAQRQPNRNLTQGPPVTPSDHQHEGSPFGKLKPLQVESASKSDTKPSAKLSQEVFLDRTNKGIKSVSTVPQTLYKSDAVDVPPYTDYLSLRDNVLAENDNKLLYWPYFDEEQNEDKSKKALWEELGQRFNLINEFRPRRLVQLQQCAAVRPYAESFLEEIKCTWADVLRYLLVPKLELDVSLPHDTAKVLEAREEYCKEEFNRGSRKWKEVLARLPPSSSKALVSAGLACAAFMKLCGFSLWHLARQSSYAKIMISETEAPKADQNEDSFEFRPRACRVCHLHDCPYHGEILEEADEIRRLNRDSSEDLGDGSEDEHASRQHSPHGSSSDESNSSITDDDDFDVLNYKRNVTTIPRGNVDAVYVNAIQQTKRSTHFWLTKSKTHLLHARRPFYPCSHEGSCEEAQCRCFKENIVCEKTCACPQSCRRRFRGCTCARGGKVCWQNQKCDCFVLNRECDVDLCGTCGAAEVLDPVNRYNEEVAAGKCTNVYIQRNLPKRTLLGHSEVQGFGLYMGEKAKKDEYLGEYKGEILTSGEAGRRGAIYQHMKTNYLFSLNKEQDVDSTRAGNKFRFINNSNEDATINCYPKMMLCNTVVRIGMYAKRDLRIGEELFFNYGYPKEITKHFWEKGQRKPKAGAQLVPVKSKKERATAGDKGRIGRAAKTSTSKPSASSSRSTSRPGHASSSRVAPAKRATKTGNANGTTIMLAERPKRSRARSSLGIVATDVELQAVFADEGVETNDSEEPGEADGDEFDEYAVPPSDEYDDEDEDNYAEEEAADSEFEVVAPKKEKRGHKRKYKGW